MLTRMTMYILALSDSLKEKDVQSTNQSCQDIMNCLKDLIPLWLEFEESLGLTARYWIMYIEMVQIVLCYRLSERMSVWLGHIEKNPKYVAICYSHNTQSIWHACPYITRR